MIDFLQICFVAGILAVSSTEALDCVTYYTPWLLDHDAEFTQLSGHPVACPQDMLLQQYSLEIDKERAALGAHRIRYTCCEADFEEEKCNFLDTNHVTGEQGKRIPFYLLGNIDIACPAGQMMRSVALTSPCNGCWRYHYSCCPVVNTTECRTHETTPTKYNGDRIFTLGDHNLNCPANKVISQYKLMDSGRTNYYYRYTCCSVPYVPCKEPIDDYRLVVQCEGSLSCTYMQRTGTSKSITTAHGGSTSLTEAQESSVGLKITKAMSFGLQAHFSRKLGKSSTTGYNWYEQSSSAYLEEESMQAEFDCYAGQRCALSQVVGRCGGFLVQSNSFKLERFSNKTGHAQRNFFKV